MKKVLFGMLFFAMCILAASVLSSCDSKKEVQKIDGYELIANDGLIGLQDSDGFVRLAPEYEMIQERPEYKALFATRGDTLTIVVDGLTLFTGRQATIVPSDNPDYVYLTTPEQVSLWKIGTLSILGPFDDLRLIEDVVFLKDKSGWGATTLDHNGLAPRKFNRIIVVKNSETFAILVLKDDTWTMYDKDGVSDGVQYDTPSQELEKQIKSLGVEDDVAVVKVTWPL
jgi:hypothetical protein